MAYSEHWILFCVVVVRNTCTVAGLDERGEKGEKWGEQESIIKYYHIVVDSVDATPLSVLLYH